MTVTSGTQDPGKDTRDPPLLPRLEAVFGQLDQILHFLCLISVKLHDLFLKLKRQCYFFKPQERAIFSEGF